MGGFDRCVLVDVGSEEVEDRVDEERAEVFDDEDGLPGDLQACDSSSQRVVKSSAECVYEVRTQVLHLDHIAILQPQAVHRSLLVIGDQRAVFLCYPQAVDVKLSFGGDAVVEVTCAALNVDAGLFGELWNAFACRIGSDKSWLGSG